MSTLSEIESAISLLPVAEVESLQEWLEQWLEDQRQMTPEFLVSIEKGKADLAEGVASNHPPMSGAATQIFSREFDVALTRLPSAVGSLVLDKIFGMGLLLDRFPHYRMTGRNEY